MDNFSLLKRQWIPVVNLKAERHLVSLRQALLEAPSYQRIDTGQPLEDIAIYRLLLAILHRALQGPKDIDTAAEWYKSGLPTQPITDYLQTYANRFDLFGEQPFLQVKGLDEYQDIGDTGKVKNFLQHWSWLSTSEGRANTTALFNPLKQREEVERTDEIPIERSIRILLEHQTFALGGLLHAFATNPGDAASARSALFLVEGATLEKTLILNLPVYPEMMRGDYDQPLWEQPVLTPQGIKKRRENNQTDVIQGFAQHYTWPSRGVTLTRTGDNVTGMGYSAGLAFAKVAYRPGTSTDPMQALLPAKDQQYRTYQLDRDRLLWRDLDGLLGQTGTMDLPVLTHAVDVLKAMWESKNELLSARQRHGQARPIAKLSVFGQFGASGKEKLFGFRRESYSLPQHFLDGVASVSSR